MSENVYQQQQQQQQQQSRTPKVFVIKFLVQNCKPSICLTAAQTVSHGHLQQSSFVTHTCSSREFIGSLRSKRFRMFEAFFAS